MLRSNLCDYSDAYIVVKGRISVSGTNDANQGNKKLTFKNNARFRSCMSKINNTFLDNVEDLNIVIPMYNLLEYSGNYSMTSRSLWNYYRDQVNDSAIENDDDNKISNKRITSKSFEYKTKIIGSTSNNNMLDAKVVVPLKYLSNFWRFLDLPLINCEIELDLKWTTNCVMSEIPRTCRVVNPNADPVVYEVATTTIGATFQGSNAKLYVPFVTLSINDNFNFLENIRQGFRRTISWNQHRSEITTQPKNNYLDYLIDPTFRNINRLFVLSFKSGDDDPTRCSFDKYYMPLVEIKDFNALIDNKQFFDQPVKSKQAYGRLIEMSRNNDNTTGNLLDYLSHQKYKLIGINLLRQTNTSIPQQINFTGKLEAYDGAAMFFVSEKEQKTILNFSLDSLIATE